MPSATSEQGLVHVAPEKELEDYSVDIIAVPGLGADPRSSFISEGTSKFDWLGNEKEGILSDIRTARVLKYSYDSRWLGDKALKQTLNNVAELFLDSLVDKRKGHDQRPIIFVAHSLGGLVVAKALTLAVSHPEKIERMRIYECFGGGIFFGTPFGGSSKAAQGVMLATFLNKFKEGIPSQLMQVLDPERDSLIELRNDFSELAQKEPKANIVCIYEQKETNYVRALGERLPKFMLPSGLVVTEASATLDGSVVRGMAVDHRQLPRFDGGKDGRFASIKVLLRDIERDARRVTKKRLNASKRSVVDDGTFSRLADSLNIVQFQRKRRSLETSSGNSNWILTEPIFLHWLSRDTQRDHSDFLWVSGSEGLGKSKAALAAVEEVEKVANTVESDVMVAYFFSDATPDSQSAENMLKSLLWQLILKRRSLAQYVRGFAAAENAKSANSQKISFSKLWSGLQDMLRDDSAPRVYFVLNNLHYLANEDTTNEFWDKIRELTGESSDVADPIRRNVKWLFLSRARDSIRSVLERSDGQVLRINLEDGSKDRELRQMLRTFTHDRVKALARVKNYSLALQYFVASVLLKRAENNKLWVEVVCCLLEALPSNYVDVRKTLEALPQSVEELMNKVWAQSLNTNTESIHRTKEILRTLAVVYEYPTLDELRVIAELDDAEDAEQIQKQVRDCGPLLRIYDDDSTGDDLGSFRVTFIHESAKVALLSQPSSRKLIGLSDSDDGTDQTEVQLQHGILALRSFSYTMNQVGQDDDNFNFVQSDSTDEKDDDPAPELKGLFPDTNDDDDEGEEEDDYFVSALEYPVKYWLRHGYEATADFVDTLDLKHAFWASESLARKRWWSRYTTTDDNVTEELQNLTSMHVAAYFGLTTLIDSLLRQGHAHEIHVRDSWDNQPLHWAASQGHIDAMERLISNKADINDGQQDGVWTPLQMAASSGQVEAMKFLMSRRYGQANIDSIAKDIGTALTLALSRNEEKAAHLLLDYGANPILTAVGGESSVATAAFMGQEELVNKLLQKGGAYNLTSKDYGSALAAGASTGQLSIVKTLLQYSDANALQQALEEATKSGFHLIVQLLLQVSRQLRCDKAFQTAAASGYDLVLQELWDHNRGQNLQAISEDAINNALFMAVDNEQDTAVLFLLEKCRANPNALGEKYGNAITAAAFDGNVAILHSLLHYRADVNAPTGYPLQAAASQGHLDVVKLLLDSGAHVNATADYPPHFTDGTALQAACVARQTEIATELLNRGADPNLGGGTLTNPITAAASNALGDLVILLLQKGANPNVNGGTDNSTPLVNAACTLSYTYLESMIKYGAVVNAPDPDGDTALIMSASYADNDCVKVLLDHGANVNFNGKTRGTALHVAAQEGHVETVRLLLQRGADPTIRGGPYDTVVQAAAYSGQEECMKALIGDDPSAQRWKNKINVNVQGGKCFTALHAAAVNQEDGCVKLLLEHKPTLNFVPRTAPNTESAVYTGSALYAASYSGCNRNARLLLEAGADPNIGGSKHGTVLQAAALKGSDELCKLLIEHKAKINGWSGKYGSALVAAVVKDYHYDDTSVLESLLEQDFDAQAYRAALETAFNLQRRYAFRLIWLSVKAKGPKKVKLSTKQLLTYFQGHVRGANYKDMKKQEDKNSDFGDNMVYFDQDFESWQTKENEEGTKSADAEDKTADGTQQARNGQANGQANGAPSRGLYGDATGRGNVGEDEEGTEQRGGNEDKDNNENNYGSGNRGAENGDGDDGQGGGAYQNNDQDGDENGSRNVANDEDGNNGEGQGDINEYPIRNKTNDGDGDGDEDGRRGHGDDGNDGDIDNEQYGNLQPDHNDDDDEENQGYHQQQGDDDDENNGYAGQNNTRDISGDDDENQNQYQNQYQNQNQQSYYDNSGYGNQDQDQDQQRYSAYSPDQTNQGYAAYDPNQESQGYAAYNPNQGGEYEDED